MKRQKIKAGDNVKLRRNGAVVVVDAVFGRGANRQIRSVGPEPVYARIRFVDLVEDGKPVLSCMAQTAVRRHKEARASAIRAAEDAATLGQRAAYQLQQAGFSLRDSATIMGLSFKRVAQLLNDGEAAEKRGEA